jgi:hypothetical protein
MTLDFASLLTLALALLFMLAAHGFFHLASWARRDGAAAFYRITGIVLGVGAVALAAWGV